MRRRDLILAGAALLAGCRLAAASGPVARIAVTRVETRIAPTSEIWFAGARDDPRPVSPRMRIAADVDAALTDALDGIPGGDRPVALEVLVTRYRIRSLLRGVRLHQDHLAEATITLRDTRTGQPVGAPLAVRARSTERVALRAVRPSPSRRLNATLAADIRAALDRITC